MKTLRLAFERPTPYLPGQHFVVRLTAPDGYRASRSYSAATPPDDPPQAVELTVERLPDGEVSSFLHEAVEAGDALELRGPIGGHFTWRGEAPAVLVGGGSGLVPLMAMLRAARRAGRGGDVRVVASVRTPADLPYADEMAGPDATVVYTRVAPPGHGRPAGRLARADLAPLVGPGAMAFVCGSSPFVEAVTDILADLGVPAAAIRVERFGPTAG